VFVFRAGVAFDLFFRVNHPDPRPSLTLTLLQAREAAMAFFRPLLNEHDLTGR
jgi:hypothetical protein